MARLIYKTKPWPHQARALKRMVRQRGGGLQVRMRWGKSWVAINWAASLFFLEDVRRVIVVTIPSGMGVWEDQIAEHCPIPWGIISHHGEALWEDNFKKSHSDKLEFLLVDYPNVYQRARTGNGREWIVVPHPTLRKFDAQAMVVDESHHIGNPTAAQSKHIYAIAQPIKFRLFMTGTMFHRKPFYVFGQAKFYDDGKTFGSAFTHFKKKIAVMHYYKVLRYRNLKWMMREMRRFTYIEKDVPPSRPPVHNHLTFELTGKHLNAYLDMERDRVLHVQGEVLTAEMILTLHLRLLMIAGGFVKLPTGKYAQVGGCKLAMFKDRIGEYLEQDITKAVVACRFLPEIAACARVAKVVGFQPILFYGAVSKDKRKRRIALFHETKKPALFISQIATGKEAIDLSVADTTLWYSLTESAVEFSQFGARTELYREKRVLMHDYLLAHGTHDMVAYEAMKIKMDTSKFIITHPQWVEEITQNKRRRG